MKKINKKTINMFIITLLIAMLAYIYFLPGYYSIDTVKIIKEGYVHYATEYSLLDGRIFMFIILNLAGLIKLSLEALIQILLILGIIVSSINVIKIYNVIEECKTTANKKIKILVYMISFCFIFNFMYIDSLEFIEGIIMAFSILFYIKSAEEIVIKNKSLKGLLYCFIGVLFYQGTINVFASIVVLFLMINKDRSKKVILKKLLITCAIILISVGLDALIVHVIRANIDITQPKRFNWSIMKNLKQIYKRSLNLIIDSVYLFPKYLQISIIFIIMTIIFIKHVKEKKILKILSPICFILICYLSSYALTILTPEMLTSINGRIFLPTGIIVSALLIYAYIETDLFEEKILGKIIQVICILYFAINLLNNIDVTKSIKEGNNIDREISYEIRDCIEAYEKETNTEIKKIAVRYTHDLRNYKKWIRSKKLTMSYNSLVYETYTGEKLEDTDFKPKIRVEYFNKIEKAIKCIDDTVYVYM